MVSRVKSRDILSKPDDYDDEPVKAKQEQSEGRRGLLNWTFTPPPDVSAAEVGKRPQAVPEPEPEEAEEPVAVLEPAPQAVAPVETAPPQEPEQAAEPVVMSVTPAAVPAAPAGDVRQAVTAQPVPSSSNGKVTIDICTARSLQNEAWGDPGISDKKYSSIASKEYTEISKAMAAGGSPEHLREELVHLASVCIAWADAIDKRLASQEENAA